MNQDKSKVRIWIEKRLIGKITTKEYNMIKGRYTNKQIRALSREQTLRIIGR